jgi:hypothetical protein
MIGQVNDRLKGDIFARQETKDEKQYLIHRSLLSEGPILAGERGCGLFFREKGVR